MNKRSAAVRVFHAISYLLAAAAALYLAHLPKWADAAEPAGCEDTPQAIQAGVLRVRRAFDRKDGVCRSWVDRGGGGGRMVIAGSNGMLTVFESVKGIGSTRIFMFFPRRTMSSFQIRGEDVDLELATGDRIRFSGKTGLAQSMTGAEIHETEAGGAAARGGIEISGFRGLMADFGYSSSSVWSKKFPNRTVKFTDAAGASCVLRHKDVVAYGFNNTFRYAKDAELAKALHQNPDCAHLDVSSLLDPSASGPARAPEARRAEPSPVAPAFPVFVPADPSAPRTYPKSGWLRSGGAR